VLARVSETNPIGVLTNGDGEQQRAKLERHGIDRFVDDVIVSNDVGARKPDQRIFDLAYFKYRRFALINENDGYFVSRLKKSANPVITEELRE
jgi:IS4 transposase